MRVPTCFEHGVTCPSPQDEEWAEQSSDVRGQLRFFEQLERMEKQRKDEQEREILLKAAKVGGGVPLGRSLLVHSC